MEELGGSEECLGYGGLFGKITAERDICASSTIWMGRGCDDQPELSREGNIWNPSWQVGPRGE